MIIGPKAKFLIVKMWLFAYPSGKTYLAGAQKIFSYVLVEW